MSGWKRLPLLLWLSLRGRWWRVVRTVLTALGVAVAVARLTLFLSLGAGLRPAVQAQVDRIRPQIQVSHGGPLEALRAYPESCGANGAIFRQMMRQATSWTNPM